MGKEVLSHPAQVIPPQTGCYLGVFPGWGETEDDVSSYELEEFTETLQNLTVPRGMSMPLDTSLISLEFNPIMNHIPRKNGTQLKLTTLGTNT